ncbi:hypothetical protein C8T65DRAFT_272062 [Cerioporus squamosus]|nr:hypothetical protein C8T65DRAFT_272062 [Cerioporus squamosus]
MFGCLGIPHEPWAPRLSREKSSCQAINATSRRRLVDRCTTDFVYSVPHESTVGTRRHTVHLLICVPSRRHCGDDRGRSQTSRTRIRYHKVFRILVIKPSSHSMLSMRYRRSASIPRSLPSTCVSNIAIHDPVSCITLTCPRAWDKHRRLDVRDFPRASRPEVLRILNVMTVLLVRALPTYGSLQRDHQRSRELSSSGFESTLTALSMHWR